MDISETAGLLGFRTPPFWREIEKSIGDSPRKNWTLNIPPFHGRSSLSLVLALYFCLNGESRKIALVSNSPEKSKLMYRDILHARVDISILKVETAVMVRTSAVLFYNLGMSIGDGFDVVIFDCPIPGPIDRCKWAGTYIQKVEEKSKCCILIQHRTHHVDLTKTLGYSTLKFPVHNSEGDLLFPFLFSEDKLRSVKKALLPNIYSAKFMQRPV